jgi:hypothetical protein
MPTVPFIMVADRGMLKAYEVRQTNHGPSPHLIRGVNFNSAREHYRDKLTDQAGAFPSTGSSKHANAIAEKQTLEAEEDARLFKSIADQIERLIRQYQPITWSFAAPAEINPHILKQIPADLQKILTENVKHDLTRTHAADLRKHFDHAQL